MEGQLNSKGESMLLILKKMEMHDITLKDIEVFAQYYQESSSSSTVGVE